MAQFFGQLAIETETMYHMYAEYHDNFMLEGVHMSGKAMASKLIKHADCTMMLGSFADVDPWPSD